jgi:hypothetical protein
MGLVPAGLVGIDDLVHAVRAPGHHEVKPAGALSGAPAHGIDELRVRRGLMGDDEDTDRIRHLSTSIEDGAFCYTRVFHRPGDAAIGF